MALALALLASPALGKKDKPAAELVLDAADPVVTVELDGESFRLRVDLAQWDAIELNPQAAARLKLPWTAGRHLAVGRVTLWGSTAETKLRIAGRSRLVQVAHHGRVAANDADGVIGPDLLPQPLISWRREGVPAWTDTLVLPLALADATGIAAPVPAVAPGLLLRFTLQGEGSSATAAGGALLAQAYGGRFAGPPRPIPITLGVARPARPIRFATPPRLAGFLFPVIATRVADFRGDNALPDEPEEQADIVVAHRDAAQRAEPWVTIGPDRLSRCAEIVYQAKPRSLILRCAFDR